MGSLRLVFLGSPPFATPILARLVASPHRPICVVTPPDRRRGRGRKLEPSPIAELARGAGIELHQPESARDPALLDRLRALEADVFLVASYGEILREEFLSIPRAECLNVHPSLLPRHRGATPVQAAILAGDEITGTSIQRVVLELDAGDVVVALETPTRRGETAGELAARLAELSGDAAIQALDALEAGTAVFTPQNPDRVTFCRKLEKESGRMDWTHPAPELERHVLAMNPWPAAQTTLPDDKALLVLRAEAVEGSGEPGVLLDAGKDFVVACGEGALRLDEVRPAGKRAMGGGDFLRGARLAPGNHLGRAPGKEPA